MFVHKFKNLEWSFISVAQVLSKQKDFVLLDSCGEGAFSLLAFSPSRRLVFSSADQSAFQKFFASIDVSTSIFHPDFHFTGGWLGFIAYEAYAFSSQIPFQPSHWPDYPLASFGYYETFLYQNHKTDELFFVTLKKNGGEELEKFLKLLSEVSNDGVFTPQEPRGLKPDVSFSRYKDSFQKIQESLHRGDYFEINYTIPFSIPFSGSPLSLYQTLRRVAPAPMMAFLNLPGFTILSASPEEFFTLDHGTITTRPIKGTIKRGASILDDEAQKQKLINSSKDQAELLMVTDLLRNDVGRLCEIGSVTVKELKKIETFSHYHHLHSVITGRLKNDTTLWDVFEALFPGGSITGAPKIQVMRHIDELEERARGVYTGALGLISNSGFVEFNIPIRTLTIQNGVLNFATGGGIVADSVCEAEYQECLLKASGVIQALKELSF